MKKGQMLFNQLEIKEEHKSTLKKFWDILNADRGALFEISEKLHEDKGLLFASISELYPELEGYEFTVDKEKFIITIMGRIRETK